MFRLWSLSEVVASGFSYLNDNSSMDREEFCFVYEVSLKGRKGASLDRQCIHAAYHPATIHDVTVSTVTDLGLHVQLNEVKFWAVVTSADLAFNFRSTVYKHLYTNVKKPLHT